METDRKKVYKMGNLHNKVYGTNFPNPETTFRGGSQ